jgi:hypothetical protein
MFKVRKLYARSGLRDVVVFVFRRVDNVFSVDVPRAGHEEFELRITSVCVDRVLSRESENKLVICGECHAPDRAIPGIALPRPNHLCVL